MKLRYALFWLPCALELIFLEQMLKVETTKVDGQIICRGDNLQKLLSVLEQGMDTDGEGEHGSRLGKGYRKLPIDN